MTPDPIAMSRAAWNVIRREHQPPYDDLEQSYRDRLVARAEAVIADRRTLETEGVFFEFEQELLEQLMPERFHPDNPKPVEDVIEEKPKPKKAVKVVKKGKK